MFGSTKSCSRCLKCMAPGGLDLFLFAYDIFSSSKIEYRGVKIMLLNKEIDK